VSTSWDVLIGWGNECFGACMHLCAIGRRPGRETSCRGHVTRVLCGRMSSVIGNRIHDACCSKVDDDDDDDNDDDDDDDDNSLAWV
jgi:hypothetical protein